MKRRQFLSLGMGAAAATGAASVPGIGTASAESADVQIDSRPDELVDRAFEYVTLAMDAYQQGSTLRIIQSFTDSQPQGDGLTFSEVLPATAYIYDSSLAIIAFLGRGQPGRRGHDDLRRAMVLGDSLLYAQDHDPVYSDGRLRSAYWVAPFVVPGARNDFYFVRPDGTVNLVGAPWFILGGSTGEMACAGIALAHLFARTRARRYLDGAVRLGQWIVDSAFDSTGLGGYTYGVDADNHRIAPTKSLEHNAGVYALFTNFLAPLTGDGRWDDLGQHARLFIDAMWNPERGFFYIGSADGKTVNDTILAVDVQAWSYLALLDRRYAAGLDWGKTNMATTDTPLSLHSSLKGNLCLSGVGFTDAGRRATEPANPSLPLPDPDAVWLTGTAQLAAALRARRRKATDLPTFHGDLATASEYLANIALAQAAIPRGQRVGDVVIPDGVGMVRASSALNTGFGQSYDPVLHIATTSWSLIAALGLNPFQLP
jgi:hypothetical protein